MTPVHYFTPPVDGKDLKEGVWAFNFPPWRKDGFQEPARCRGNRFKGNASEFQRYLITRSSYG